MLHQRPSGFVVRHGIGKAIEALGIVRTVATNRAAPAAPPNRGSVKDPSPVTMIGNAVTSPVAAGCVVARPMTTVASGRRPCPPATSVHPHDMRPPGRRRSVPVRVPGERRRNPAQWPLIRPLPPAASAFTHLRNGEESPPLLAGGGGGGGDQAISVQFHPSPDPLPQGEGEILLRTASASAMCECHRPPADGFDRRMARIQDGPKPQNGGRPCRAYPSSTNRT